MSWPELADAVLIANREILGVPVAYERGAVSVGIVAPFDAKGGTITMSDGSQLEVRSPFLGVRLADLPDGVAMQGDAWLVGGIRYRVAVVIQDGHGGAGLVGEELT